VLEAALPPGMAEALLRKGPLAARRIGRGRGRPVGLAWLDTAEGALAAAGLALEQGRRGPPRLLRIIPEADGFWLPGTPPPEAGALAPGELPAEAGDAAVVPVAGFAGSITRFGLQGGVEAALLKGQLRSVAEERPAARLTLSGPPAAVLETVAALAEAVPLLPPRAALAEEGRALARGEALRPRRLGAPVLDPALDIEAALCVALGHLTEVLLWHAPAARSGATPEGVHQMRVAMRRLRSLIRVFRPACDGPALRAFDASLRDMAKLLGPARDWDVWLAELGAELAEALPEDPRIAALLRAGRQRREAAYAALRPALDGPELRRLAWEAVALATMRPWRAEGGEAEEERRAQPLSAFAARVLERRWKRLAKGSAHIAGLPDPEFHALRIEAKRMRYAAELFAPLWGRKRARRFLERLATVQDAFGLANDAVVARLLMAELRGKGSASLAWASGVAEGWALARARRARDRAAKAWDALFDEGIYWNQG
jgi:CHAD domain-containing protein